MTTQDLIQKEQHRGKNGTRLVCFLHPPYLPDLVATDYSLYQLLQNTLNLAIDVIFYLFISAYIIVIYLCLYICYLSLFIYLLFISSYIFIYLCLYMCLTVK